MTEIDLSNAHLSGHVPDITNLTTLRSLNLANNKIQSLSDTFPNLQSLERLSLAHNAVLRGERIDETIARLDKIFTLDLSGAIVAIRSLFPCAT